MAIIKFPPIESTDEYGLLAIGGDLEVTSLLLAYTHGIFPWPISSKSPMAWFCPDPRGILEFKDLHISKSLKKLLKQNKYHVSFNQNFKEVITNCAKLDFRSENESTWITTDIINAYTKFHEAGYAYSVEVTNLSGQLVGGLYGVNIGSFVNGESMFHKENNASKIALVSLMQYINSKGTTWLDTQMVSPIVKNLGGKEISRNNFMKKIKNLFSEPKIFVQ